SVAWPCVAGTNGAWRKCNRAARTCPLREQRVVPRTGTSRGLLASSSRGFRQIRQTRRRKTKRPSTRSAAVIRRNEIKTRARLQSVSGNRPASQRSADGNGCERNRQAGEREELRNRTGFGRNAYFSVGQSQTDSQRDG